MASQNLTPAMDAYIAIGTRFDFCTAEPTTYAEATSAYSIGNKTGLVLQNQARTPNGRKLVVPSFSGGTQTGTPGAVPTFWAITDPAGSRLLFTGAVPTGAAILGTPNTIGLSSDLAAWNVPDAVAGS